ncbi:hypothetical protein BV25DRAFT_1542887 [Artomyces pyxidatus]|uniref:Uncharacterized protein n=1 Tax=Artomyces pyxidatus TaxID=48021 RepID=A0ACB8SLH0_9AGAM|nr:hypothetical protein BV25DRAFT_1542887 [Artomyces pyxidatus]
MSFACTCTCHRTAQDVYRSSARIQTCTCTERGPPAVALTLGLWVRVCPRRSARRSVCDSIDLRKAGCIDGPRTPDRCRGARELQAGHARPRAIDGLCARTGDRHAGARCRHGRAGESHACLASGGAEVRPLGLPRGRGDVKTPGVAQDLLRRDRSVILILGI